jgi:hypothetical protein
MNMLQGLLLTVAGLLVIALWLFPFVYVQYALAPREDYPVSLIVSIIGGAGIAFDVLIKPFSWDLIAMAISLVGIIGFILFFGGLYCLVCSLRESRS